MLRRLLRVACIGALLAGPVGPAVAAEADIGAELPACTDKTYVQQIRSQYDFAESMREGHPIAAMDAVEEAGLGAPPESANQYATETTRVVGSRYCTASLKLDDGSTDTLLWRLDYVRDNDEHYIRYDHCSDRHDTFEDKCAAYRPPE
ncbi:MAG: hypothetical protein AB7P52_12020 [Alphaproteobacteria bacterium]